MTRLFLGLWLMANFSFAQNEKLKWLEGQWEGEGVVASDANRPSKIIKFTLNFDIKTQELMVDVKGEEKFFINFNKADKGNYDIELGDKIRFFVAGDYKVLDKNIYISKNQQDQTYVYLLLSCFYTRQEDKNPVFFAMLKKRR
jgi:hypothetical protein